jgi:hypothetical protein
MKAFAVCALALLAAFAVPYARADDTPTLKLDLAQSQDLTVDASGVQLEQLLKTLGEHLNFTVDFSPLANRSALVSGKFEGDLDDVLADILRGTNYVARRGLQGVTHLVVMTASNGSPAATPAASGKNAVAAVDVKSPPQPGPAAAQAHPPGADADRAAQAGAPAQNTGGNGPPSVVSKLLSAQAGAMLPADPNAPAQASAPATGTQSLGVMTRVAQTNVQALVSALNTACIGTGCAH